MGPPVGGLAGLAVQAHDQRLVTVGEQPQRLVHVLYTGKVGQARAAGVDLPGGLRAAQHQHRQRRQLAARQVEGAVEQVPHLGDAVPGAGRGAGETAAHQPLNGSVDVAGVVGRDGVARRLLIAGGDQAVHRQRIVIGRRESLLGQGARHADFDRIESRSGHGQGTGWARWAERAWSKRPDQDGGGGASNIRGSRWVGCSRPRRQAWSAMPRPSANGSRGEP